MHNVGVDMEGFSLLLPHDVALIRARGIGAEVYGAWSGLLIAAGAHYESPRAL